MNTPRFPRSPDIHNRPFQDGANPFKDEGSDSQQPQSPSANAYSTSSGPSDRPVEADVYERFLPNRSGKLFTLGMIGFMLACLSLILSLAAITSSGWLEWLVQLLPISLSCVALTIPAWYLAHGDLRAIRAGAMDSRGRRKTRWAYWLGLLGTVAGFLPAAGGLVSLFMFLTQ